MCALQAHEFLAIETKFFDRVQTFVSYRYIPVIARAGRRPARWAFASSLSSPGPPSHRHAPDQPVIKAAYTPQIEVGIPDKILIFWLDAIAASSG